MLNAIGFMIKVTAFAILVLVVGNWAQWGGKTLSGQVAAAVSRVQNSEAAEDLREWVRKLTRDAHDGAQKKNRRRDSGLVQTAVPATTPVVSDTTHAEAAAPERISSSERQKLRELIRELNGSRGKN